MNKSPTAFLYRAVNTVTAATAVTKPDPQKRTDFFFSLFLHSHHYNYRIIVRCYLAQTFYENLARDNHIDQVVFIINLMNTTRETRIEINIGREIRQVVFDSFRMIGLIFNT